jgi:hypothetical protein
VNLSSFLKKLQKIKKQHGDINVLVRNIDVNDEVDVSDLVLIYSKREVGQEERTAIAVRVD